MDTMIETAHGNLLEAEVDALVNTVNCVGYMGKGIALQFKQAFPENFKAYQSACARDEVRPGNILAYPTGRFDYPKYILNFPTKRHWRGNSRIEDIESGLSALVDQIRELEIQSVAIPPLGCGNGGLNWTEVRPRILRALESLPNVRVLLYEPTGAPLPREMPVRTSRPRLTEARALFIRLIDRYTVLAYRLTLLEIQKLAYFLQEAGQPLKLNYEKGHYGPYAQNLNKVLERMEGHFTRGYGDSQKPDVEISLMEGAVEEAELYLRGKQEEQNRLDHVSRLIEGFETPYGMELLATVHWVAIHEENGINSPAEAYVSIRTWNARKKKLFSAEHIAIAWARLVELGWIDSKET